MLVRMKIVQLSY